MFAWGLERPCGWPLRRLFLQLLASCPGLDGAQPISFGPTLFNTKCSRSPHSTLLILLIPQNFHLSCQIITNLLSDLLPPPHLLTVSSLEQHLLTDNISALTAQEFRASARGSKFAGLGYILQHLKKCPLNLLDYFYKGLLNC